MSRRDRLVRVGALWIVLLLGAACMTIAPGSSEAPGPTGSPGPSNASPPYSAIPIATQAAPSAVVSLMPSATPKASRTPKPPHTPGATQTTRPSPSPGATATPTAAPPDQLDWRLDPNSGTISIASGFLDDPKSVDLIAGGTVDASYMGDGCLGYVTAAPDLKVEYTNDSGSGLLRFYFVVQGTGDATMIVNPWNGQWSCNDDSYGGTNPTVSFNNPGGGEYDIWIGTAGSPMSWHGQVFITEIDQNHP